MSSSSSCLLSLRGETLIQPPSPNPVSLFSPPMATFFPTLYPILFYSLALSVYNTTSIRVTQKEMLSVFDFYYYYSAMLILGRMIVFVLGDIMELSDYILYIKICVASTLKLCTHKRRKSVFLWFL